MLRLLIAEDDRETREGLCDCIQWQDYGIELVKAVSNGIEAMEYLDANDIDILLTDIKMPLLDGVQLIQHMRMMGQKTRAIIITAYWEKEYLKAAFEFSVTDYILKPVKLAELDKVLRKVCQECRMEKAQSEKHAQLVLKLQESIPTLREKMIRDLLTGRIKGEAHIRNWLVFAELPFQFDDWFTVLCADFTDNSEKNADSGRPDGGKDFSANPALKEMVGDLFEIYSLRLDDNEYVFLMASRSPAGCGKQTAAAEAVQNVLKRIAGRDVTIGVGREFSGMENIHISYQEAVRAMEYRFFSGDGRVIHFNEINNTQPTSKFNYRKLQDSLIQHVRLGLTEQALACVEDIFENIKKTDALSIEFIRSICLEIAVNINRQLFDVIPDTNIYSSEFIWKEVLRLKTLGAMKEWMSSAVRRITETIWNHMNNTYNNSVSKIIDIISKNYMDDLTIKTIADQMYMTPNYLCLLFKKHTGKTINESITKTRMEKAMEMLRDPSVKVSEVSRLVGYKDADYFTKVFKRYTGMKPIEYKEMSFK